VSPDGRPPAPLRIHLRRAVVIANRMAFPEKDTVSFRNCSRSPNQVHFAVTHITGLVAAPRTAGNDMIARNTGRAAESGR
jgi:hypothetical protein